MVTFLVLVPSLAVGLFFLLRHLGVFRGRAAPVVPEVPRSWRGCS